MLRTLTHSVLFCSLVMMLGCQGFKLNPFAGDKPTSDLARQNINALLPKVYSKSAFANTDNFEFINVGLKNLSKSAHGMSQEKLDQFAKGNVAKQLVLDRQKKTSTDLVHVYKNKNFSHARPQATALMEQCMSCHSSSQVKSPWKFDFSQLKIKWLERADLYFASGDAEGGITEIRKVMYSPHDTHTKKPFQKELAMERLMYHHLLEKEDVKAALEVVNKYAALKRTPKYMLEALGHWKKDIKTWLVQGVYGMAVDTRGALLNAEKTLKTDGYDAALIKYIRLAVTVQERLGKATTTKSKGTLYSQLGKAYQVLKNAGPMDQPAVYFERCIEEYPKSDIARECYGELEKETLLMFTGTTGNFLSESETARLKRLKTLSGL